MRFLKSIILLLTILFISFISIRGLCNTYDNDTSLEFCWTAATGNIHHYNVYLSVDGGDYFLVGATSTTPTPESLYSLPIAGEDNRQYQIKVQAEDANGMTGPMSEPSDPVCCELSQSIVLTSFNGSEAYQGSLSHVINWQTTGALIDHIHILYSTDRGLTYQDIAANTENDGIYEWTAPAIDSSTVRVKIMAEGTSNNSLAEDQSDADFTIDSTAPGATIALTGTQGAGGWYATDVTVELSATDNLSGVKGSNYKIDEGTWQSYSSPFTISGGTVYYYSTDNAGNAEAEKSTLVMVDKTAPDAPVVTDDGECTSDGSQLHASWVSSDPQSGIAEYQYAIGASPGETGVVGWTSVGAGTEVTAAELSLTIDHTYYFSVKARNEAGLWSGVGNSDGIAYHLPQILVTPDSLTYQAVAGGTGPGVQKLSIANPGCGILVWTVSDNASWLSLSPANGDTTDEIDEAAAYIDITGLTAGTYEAAITISAANASNTPQIVPVTLNIAEPFSVTVSDPNGGERIKGNSIHRITWNATGNGIDHVHLLYTADDGATYQNIVANAANNGAHDWMTPGINSSKVHVKAIVEDSSSSSLAEDQSDSDFTIDSTPPAAPTGLTASAGDKQVILCWVDNSESDLADYKVYRRMTPAEDYALIASVTVNSYTDSGLQNGNTYRYAVTAADLVGNASGFSNEASATPAEMPSGSVTLTVNGGNSNSGEPLTVNERSLVQSSDNSWLPIPAGCYAAFQLSDVGIPAESVIISVVIYVEHWEDKAFRGSIEWDTGTGWPDSIVKWGSMTCLPNKTDQTNTWDVTDLANTPGKINSMELCIRNGSTNGKNVYIDRIHARVEWGEIDTTGPSAVSDLAIKDAGVTSNSIALVWTAPGDDGMTGTASRYDIRYSSQGAIDTEAKWSSAAQCASEPAPSAAGSTEGFTVTGLSANTTYWFALKTGDEVPNWSSLSNSQSGKTGGAADLATWVSAIDMSLTGTGPNVKAIAVVCVTGTSGASVSGATVYGHWNNEGDSKRSGLTDASGKVTFASDRIKNPAAGTKFTFTVDNIVKDGWTYNSSANIETSDSISTPLAAPAFAEAYSTNLLNAFPSPANPEIWIPYTLSSPEHVFIRIYNVSGGLVRTLELGQREPGAYMSRERAAYWDGKNEVGEQVSSGIYFCVMQAGKFEAVKKIIMSR